MIDGSEKRNRQLAFELHNSHVCEKRSKTSLSAKTEKMSFICMRIKNHFLSMADCKTVRISAYLSKRAQSNKRSATRVKQRARLGSQ